MMAVSRLLAPSCPRHRRTPLTDVVLVLLRRRLLLVLEWRSATTNADAAEGALNLSNALLLLPEKDGERRDTTNSDNAATEGMQRQ